MIINKDVLKMKKILILVSLLFLSIVILNSKFKIQDSINLVHAQTASPTPIPVTDWPQLQRDPQRSGHSNTSLGSNDTNVWQIGFAKSYNGQKINPQIQAVVAGSCLFIGTEQGTMYAFNPSTGAFLSKYPASGNVGPILGTAGVENNKVFFGSMDGAVYALNVGANCALSLTWKFVSPTRGGFSSAVLLAENKVFIPNRGGSYFALNQSDSSVSWQRDLGVPIFMSSSYNAGKIFFGAQDMKVYALNSSNGQTAWSAGPVWGLVFKDYWPVAAGEFVFVYPFKVQGGGGDTNSFDLPQHNGPLTQAEIDKQQDSVAYFNTLNDPNNSNFHPEALFVYRQDNGQKIVIPHYQANTMNGATCPPSVDRDNNLILPVGWFFNRPYDALQWGGGWARMNVNYQIGGALAPRFTEVLWPGPRGNTDENMCSSTAGNKVFVMHTQEGNAQFTGFWDLDARAADGIGASPGDDFLFWSNSQGGGTSPASFAGKMMFHNTQNTLNARLFN